MMPKNEPLVTIGLPFYNPGKYIIKAIQSIYAQEYNNWELIIINDGSKDNAQEYVDRIRDPRVKIINDGKNMGLPARLNQITELAEGKYIARMDADDIMHPRRIKSQVEYLERKPHFDVVATGVYLIDINDKIRGIRPGKIASPIDILKHGGYVHPTILGKNSWFKSNQYSLDYPRAEDRELFVRVAADKTFAVIEEPLFFYRWVNAVSVKSYIQSYSSERSILLKYGPPMVGINKTTILYIRSLIKTSILIFLSMLNMQNIITKKYHVTKFDSNVIVKGYAALAKVSSQKVPGWEALINDSG